MTRLVNDPSSKCRSMVGAALRTLLTRAAPPRVDRLAAFCEQWLRGGDERLKRAAAQVRERAAPGASLHVASLGGDKRLDRAAAHVRGRLVELGLLTEKDGFLGRLTGRAISVPIGSNLYCTVSQSFFRPPHHALV